YAKSRKVGEGTYANVYEARMLRTGLKVALKKIKVSKLRADGLDVSAVREVKFLRELEHPNIVRLHDVYAHKGNVHLVLEFLPTDLEAVIKNSALTFGPGDVKSWLMMALRGLHHCHRQLILHRDLKPNNLLLGRDGQLKLADFGLARDYGDPARALSSQVVTRWYRSPELLLGAQHYGPGVDIWAMGCIFAELLLRVPYLAGDTDIGQLHTIFRALGTPGAADWPGIELLPDYHALPQYPRTPMRTLFTAAGSETLDLLERMLVFYPPARISALAALGHRYFKMMPPPTPPAQLPGVV
ncbi:Pkinase-domain-containing protein, partial [Caulochytrium protostelioides]